MSQTLFETQFGALPARTLFVPGRVNLIGEHTDYNGGMVLPVALELGLTISLTPRKDKTVQIISGAFDDLAVRALDESARDHWSDYALGAAAAANDAGYFIGGADIAVTTTLPFGAGLSSSAAMVVGVLKLARGHGGAQTPDSEIAKLARRVENDFIGMPCGIMDQMAVAIARPGQALALQTESLEYELIDLPEECIMAVLHSGQYRRLAEGHYKARKEECDAAKAHLSRDDLCKISDAELANLDDLSPPIQARARHCMTEHRRTVLATDCLRRDDMAAFGQLMIESHRSMRDDFEITLPQIDALVETCVAKGALGARMTGGGFGGCVVACVPKNQIVTWRDAVLSQHSDAFWVC